jgi:hypothetical protein
MEYSLDRGQQPGHVSRIADLAERPGRGSRAGSQKAGQQTRR